MTAIVHKSDYRRRRAKEYPPIGDQLDALWKAFAEVGVELGPAGDAMLAKINDVKRRLPKQ